MTTHTAVGAHAAVGLVQAGAMYPAASGMLPWWAELLIQIGLIFGQGALAVFNSNTDQNGSPIQPVARATPLPKQ